MNDKMKKKFSGFGIFAIAAPVTAVSFLFVCYTMGVTSGHFPPLPHWPHLSKPGTYPPESSIYTLVMNCLAVSIAIIGLLFYKYIIHINLQSKLNKAAFGFTFITSVGFSVVGCFQTSSVDGMHTLGATLAKTGLCWYLVLVTAITWRDLRRGYCPAWLVYLRTILCVLDNVGTGIFLFFYILPEHSNIGAVMQWTALISSQIFVTTLASELKDITSVELRLSTTRHEREKNINLKEITINLERKHSV